MNLNIPLAKVAIQIIKIYETGRKAVPRLKKVH